MRQGASSRPTGNRRRPRIRMRHRILLGVRCGQLQRASTAVQPSGLWESASPILSGSLEQADAIGRANVGGDLQKLSRDLQEGGNGLNQELLRIIASIRGVSLDKVIEEFSKSIESGQKAALSERRGVDARQSQESITNSFSRLTLSVQSASDVFHRLQDSSQSLSHDLFSGSVGASRINLHGEALSQLGRNDAGALRPLRGIASIGGTAGQDLLQRGTALDAVSRILPSVLVNAGINPQVTMTQLPR